MATKDECCTLVPYFQVHAGRLASFKELCERFVAKTKNESGCLYYGFSFDGDKVHCREGYANAEGILSHLDNVGDLLQEALAMSDLARLEVHGPKNELDKLQEPLSALKPQFWQLEYGFRN